MYPMFRPSKCPNPDPARNLKSNLCLNSPNHSPSSSIRSYVSEVLPVISAIAVSQRLILEKHKKKECIEICCRFCALIYQGQRFILATLNFSLAFTRYSLICFIIGFPIAIMTFDSGRIFGKASPFPRLTLCVICYQGRFYKMSSICRTM